MQTQDEARHTTTDDVDVEAGDKITVSLIHNREEKEFTGEVKTLYNGGAFTVETDDGSILTLNDRNLKVQQSMRDERTDLGMFSYFTVGSDETDDGNDPVVVGLHDEKPEGDAHADGVWVLTECDECGTEGYTGESACYKAYELEHTGGLVCKNCA